VPKITNDHGGEDIPVSIDAGNFSTDAKPSNLHISTDEMAPPRLIIHGTSNWNFGWNQCTRYCAVDGNHTFNLEECVTESMHCFQERGE
jgi:hypothetical protein